MEIAQTIIGAESAPHSNFGAFLIKSDEKSSLSNGDS